MTVEDAKWLGFNDSEIQIAYSIAEANRFMHNASIPAIQNMLGVDYNSAYRLRYLIDLINGTKEVNIHNVETIDDLKAIAKHFKKINPQCRVLSTGELSPSRIMEIPKVAVVKGIRDPEFMHFNSMNPSDIKEYYIVERIGQSELVLRTTKRPRGNKKTDSDSRATIMGIDTKGRTLIKVSKDICRLCNRYVVVASLRYPTTHNGAYAMNTVDGTIVYVYARTIYGNRGLNSGYAERIYDYGVIPSSLDNKLKSVAQRTYVDLSCKARIYEAPQSTFSLIYKGNDANDSLLL